MASSTDKNRDATAGAAAESAERTTVWLLCLLGVIHAFIYSAAFPLFNINDEAKHYDLVLKYSHGEFQREVAPMSEEWMQYFATYGTQEYMIAPDSLPGKKFAPPLWMLPKDLEDSILVAREQSWRTLNHESSQPPLYYLLAGGWLQLGRICGFKGGYLLYWVRFLDLPLVAALVWLGYAAARLMFPERWLVRLGVPALIAFMPQTVFYSVTNDILSPLCFGLALISLVRWWQADLPKAGQSIALGVALGATFLVKMCNLPLIAVAVIFICARVWKLMQAKKLGAVGSSLLWLALCAGIPVAGWTGWCKVHFGDFTGSEIKVQLLGWTHKPIAEWFHHPIFSPGGLWTFLSGLFASLWRGEFLWHGQPLASSVVDLVYVLLSLGLTGAALWNLCLRPVSANAAQRRVLWLCLGSVVASAAFLGLISIMYDFHDCFYPSREHPYFTSGRLMLGALIPFLLLILYGLDCALNFTKGERVRRLALVVVILFMVTNEVAVDWPVFFSQYNWFHLSAGSLVQ